MPRLPRLLTALLAACLGGCSEPAPARKPNVLLVTLDTTRADYLGCYGGGPGVKTPHLDALAQDGILFEQCIGQSSATPISHASIMTGLWPFQHGLRVIYAPSGYRLKEQIPYLPEILSEHGYDTAAFLSSFTVSEFFGFDRAFDHFDNGIQDEASELMTETKSGTYRWSLLRNQRRSDRTTDRVIEWLRDRPGEEPFLVWTHYWDPHDANEDYPETYPPMDFMQESLQQMEALGVEIGHAVYSTEITWMDAQFGRLIEELKAQGLYDDTIIVVVSDHGQGLGDHRWWAHRLLYQEQIRLPLLVRVPGWSTGQRVATTVRSIDVFSTILDALEIDSPDVPGRSVRDLAGGATEAPRVAYAEALNMFDLNSTVAKNRPSAKNMYSISDGTWKLIYRFDKPERSELYHLGEDPAELQNRFATDEAEAKRLLAIMDEWAPYRSEPFPQEGAMPSEAEVEALKALGYVGDDDPEEGEKK